MRSGAKGNISDARLFYGIHARLDVARSRQSSGQAWRQNADALARERLGCGRRALLGNPPAGDELFSPARYVTSKQDSRIAGVGASPVTISGAGRLFGNGVQLLPDDCICSESPRMQAVLLPKLQPDEPASEEKYLGVVKKNSAQAPLPFVPRLFLSLLHH